MSKKVFVRFNYPTGITFEVGNKKITINGNAEDLKGQKMGVIPIGDSGLTEVDEDAWNEIVKIYGGMEIFKNKLITAQPSQKQAEDEAKEKKELRHGREPVDPHKTATKPKNDKDE